jgi:hypothetical protein
MIKIIGFLLQVSKFKAYVINAGRRIFQLSQEEGKHNQDGNEEPRQGANARQVTLHIGVIGVKLRARRLGCHTYGSCRSFGSFRHLKLLNSVIAQTQRCAVY